MGRFLNADAFASTGQGILGNNMFLYCLNNPGNYIDSAGTDAIWIQEGKSAGWQGHSGLLVQDEDDRWYYFFWGAATGGLSVVGIAKAVCVFVPLETEGYDMHDPEQVHEVLSNTDLPYVGEREQLITNMQYLEGDYTQTYEYLTELSSETSKHIYNLFLNNCVQQTYYALGRSDVRFTGYTPLHPNFTFFRVKSILQLCEY